MFGIVNWDNQTCPVQVSPVLKSEILFAMVVGKPDLPGSRHCDQFGSGQTTDRKLASFIVREPKTSSPRGRRAVH
jgi:hypothetical protein